MQRAADLARDTLGSAQAENEDDMLDLDERQKILDEEHLRLLRIVYLIHGGTYAACSFFPLIYVVFGLFLVFAPNQSNARGVDPRMFGFFFAAIGVLISIFIAVFGGLQLYAARCLRLRSSRTICLFAAGMTCLMIPLGTALGVFTFIVLGRPTVRAMFDRASLATPPAA